MLRGIVFWFALAATFALSGCGGYSINYLIQRAVVRLSIPVQEAPLPIRIDTLTPGPVKEVRMATSTPAAALPPMPDSWQRVAPEGLGISFALPAEYRPVAGLPLTWSPAGELDESGRKLFGVRVTEMAGKLDVDSQELAKLLPHPARQQSRAAYAAHAVSGWKYELETYRFSADGQVNVYETDVIVPLVSLGRAYSFWVSAPTEQDRQSLAALIRQVVETMDQGG